MTDAKPNEQLYNPQTEAALMAAAMFDRDLLLLDVTEDDFHNSELGSLWSLACAMQQAGEYVDPITLDDEIQARGLRIDRMLTVRLQALEGVDYAHGGEYAQRVKEMARRRRTVDIATLIAQAAYRSNGTLDTDVSQLAGELLRQHQLAPSQGKPQRKTSWTAAELLAADFPEPQWAVPGIIPTGLTFLAGRPKVGKSWLALQVAIAVGTGGRVLDRQVTQGRVLYLALEDNARRLKERARKQGMPRDALVHFETSWRCLTNGGLDDLQAIASQYQVIIMDTLSRALGRADQGDLADMTTLVGALQEMAIEHEIAFLIIDHHRKPSGYEGNPIDDIVGSTAKSAVADAALGLFTQQGKRGATLKVTGRDVEWQDLVLDWDPITCCWQYTGTAEEVELMGRRGDVLAVLQEHYPEAMIADEIGKETNPKLARPNVIRALDELITSGHVIKDDKRGREQPYKAVRGV